MPVRSAAGSETRAGSPAWQNPCVESFGGRLRDALLAVEAFPTLLEVRVLVEDWGIEYNTVRPHNALGYLARRIEMVFQNERMTTVIDGDGLQLAVVQVASRLVRQILSLVKEGQDVVLGERIGVIRFGSTDAGMVPAPDDRAAGR